MRIGTQDDWFPIVLGLVTAHSVTGERVPPAVHNFQQLHKPLEWRMQATVWHIQDTFNIDIVLFFSFQKQYFFLEAIHNGREMNVGFWQQDNFY